LAAAGLSPAGLSATGLSPTGLSPTGLSPTGLSATGISPAGISPAGFSPAGVSGPTFAEVRRLEHHHRRLEGCRWDWLVGRRCCRSLIGSMRRRRHNWHGGHRTGRPAPGLAAWLAARTRPVGGLLPSVSGTGAELRRLGWLGYAPACPAEQASPLAAFLT
jgi:hypothetical protein